MTSVGSFDGAPLSPTGSSHSVPRSESESLVADHTSIPWSDAGAEMHEQETLVASMLEGLTSADGPELEPTRVKASATRSGGEGRDDLETSRTTMTTKFHAPLSPSRRSSDAMATKSTGVSTAAAAAFGGGMWGAGGGSFSLWGASNGDTTSPTGDATKRTSLW